jgi:hypothetical protein
VPVKGTVQLDEIKVLIVETFKQVPGVLSDPGPEALLMSLDDAEMTSFKVHVLWSTKASHEHEMLASDDRVLTAIAKAPREHSETREQKRIQETAEKPIRAA